MNRALMAVALAACSSTSAPSQPPPSAPRDTALPTPVAVASKSIVGDSKQLVTAIVDEWTSTTATLRLWHRDKGAWVPDGATWPGVVGTAGSGWGIGIHGIGAPKGHEGPLKREGDQKSPAGVFALTTAFGYASSAPPETRMTYASMTDEWKCVDDPSSRYYNRIIPESSAGRKDWASAEAMHRKDALYTWGIEVAHNATRTPAQGSCIFLHVWAGPATHTVGCTAMPEDKLLALIEALDPADEPVFVLLPRSEYAVLQHDWDLPPL